MSAGNYYRFSLHAERARRLSILLQRSRNGRPVYVESADFTDWARITRKQNQRLAQLFTDAMDGVDAWRLEVLAGDNNFTIKGGDNTDEGAAAAWVGGLRALLYRDTDYQCVSRGAFNETDAFNIHHRASSVAVGALNDTHSKYVVNSLTGMTVSISDVGSFTVLSNTATQILLDGFDPADYPTLGVRPFYYIELFAPVADFDQPVYLDVHIEDWGVDEDETLNHNQAVQGKPVECARREVLIQRLWVQQVVDAPEMPIASTYTDATGTRHWVMKVGELNRLAADAAVPAVDSNGDHAPAPDDVVASREFQFACDAVPAVSLAERLMRDTSVITVGPSAVDGTYMGMYNGPQGLLDALACDAAGPRTVFLRHGTYNLAGIDDAKLIVRQGWTLVGETPNTLIQLQDDGSGEAMLVERHATVRNLTISRPSDSTANVAIRLGGRSSILHDVYVQDLKTSGTAVLLQSIAATGGGALIDCNVVSSGGIAVRFAALASEPPNPQGGANVNAGTDAATSPTGSIPSLTLDQGGVSLSSYGLGMYRTRVYATAAAYSADDPAVYVGAGDSVRVVDCDIMAEGCPALVVATKLSSGGSPATWEARGATLVQGTNLVIGASANYATAGSRAVSLVSGRVVIQNLRVEGIDVGSNHPEVMFGIDPDDPKMLDVDVDGLYVRTKSAYGVKVSSLANVNSQVRMSRVDVVPMSPVLGPLVGISASLTSPRGVVELSHCRVLGHSGSLYAYAIEGAVRGGDLWCDGTDVTQTAFTAGELPVTPTAAFRLRASTATVLAPTLTGCHAVAHGCLGFFVSNSGSTPARCVLQGCDVAGSSRTLIGVYSDGFGYVDLVDCRVSKTLGPNVSNGAQDEGMSVDGGRYEDAGQAYGSYEAGFPDELVGVFDLAWGACLDGVHVARGFECRGGSVGIVPTNFADIGTFRVSNSLMGVLVEYDQVRMSDVRVSGCTSHSLLVRDTAYGPTGRGIQIDSSVAAPVKILSTSSFDLELAIRSRGKNAIPLDIESCGHDGKWRVHATIDSLADVGATPFKVSNCTSGLLDRIVVRALGNASALITDSSSMRVVGLDADCGSIRISSLMAYNADDISVEASNLKYGATLYWCDGSPQVLGMYCETQGLAVLLRGGGSAQILLRDVTVRATPPTNELIYSSGVYVGGAGGVSVSGRADLERVRVHSWSPVGADHTVVVSDVAVGRSAGIRVQMSGATSYVRLKDYLVKGVNTIGVLVGDLNYLEDETSNAVNHWDGVGHLSISGGEHLQWLTTLSGWTPLLVAVLRHDTGAHSISNCFFDADADNDVVARLYAQHDANLYVRVDFKGNRSRIRTTATHADVPKVIQSEYLLLDGGMTAAEYDLADSATWTALAPAVWRTNSVWPSCDAAFAIGTFINGTTGALP